MTEIKICGITERDDALFAAECGVDALGFIFYALSPRAVTPERARDIMALLPERICRVGVFVNHDPEDVQRIAEFCRLDLLQFHGDESPAYCSRWPASRLIKACFFEREEDIEAMAAYPVRAILVDSRDRTRYGGTGKRANWDLARTAGQSRKVILAGGLCEANIGEALASVLPPAVDINSGVESAPGKKDRGKILRLAECIRGRGDEKGFNRNTTGRIGNDEKIFTR